MARHSQEDLFEGTKMTFGEHIEELRVALFQAIVGLAIGVAIGFFVADEVVKWIQTPLEKALRNYYGEKARIKAAEQYQGKIPYEMYTVIEREGLTPATMKVNAESLLMILQDLAPEQYRDVRYTPHRLRPEDIPAEHLPGLLQQWMQAREEETPERVLWRALSAEQQRTLTGLAEKEKPTEADVRSAVTILNGLLAKPALHRAPEMNDVEGINPAMEEALQELRANREEGKGLSTDDAQRLNRLLVSAIFSRYVEEPSVTLVELPFWRPIEVQVQSLGAQEVFMIWMKAAFIAGLVISAPWVFWKIWDFVAAGLYPHEKHYVYLYLPVSLLLFFAGAALAFFFVFEPVLAFLFSFNRSMNIDPDPRISEWLSFVLFLPLGFGISFQLPLVMLFLQRIGVFTVETYLSKWRIAILAIFVISMVLTPADPISMLLMACPLSVLYFGGVAMCYWMPRGRNPYRELQAYEP